MSRDNVADTLAAGLPDYFPSSDSSTNYDLLQPIADQLEKQDKDIETVDFASTVQSAGRQDLTIPAGEENVVPEGERWMYRNVYIGGVLTVNGTLTAKSVDIDGELIVNGGGLVDVDDQYRQETLTQLRALGSLISVPPQEEERIEHYRARLIAEFSVLTGEATIDTLISTAAEILQTSQRNISFSEPYQGEHGTAEIGLPSVPLDEQQLNDTEVIQILDQLIPAGYRLQGLRTGTFTYISPSDYDVSNFDEDRGYDGLGANGEPKENGGTYAGVI